VRGLASALVGATPRAARFPPPRSEGTAILATPIRRLLTSQHNVSGLQTKSRAINDITLLSLDASIARYSDDAVGVPPSGMRQGAL
jgi:hypothetical protein